MSNSPLLEFDQFWDYGKLGAFINGVNNGIKQAEREWLLREHDNAGS